MALPLSRWSDDQLKTERERLESEALDANNHIQDYAKFVELGKVKQQIEKRASEARRAEAAERIREDIEAQGERLKTLNILAKRSGLGL